jgi:hypothetical protein
MCPMYACTTCRLYSLIRSFTSAMPRVLAATCRQRAGRQGGECERLSQWQMCCWKRAAEQLSSLHCTAKPSEPYLGFEIR